MSEAGARQWGEAVELSEERAELLPDRTTLAAIEFGRKQYNPSNVAVSSPTSNNFPVGSPASNNSILANTSAPEVTGGFMPVLITLMPSVNIIVQQSDLDSLGLGHHSGDGDVNDHPAKDGYADPYIDDKHATDVPIDDKHATDVPIDDKHATDAPVDDSHAADPYSGDGGWMDFFRRLFGG